MNRKKSTSVIAVILAVLMLLALVFTVIPSKAYAVTQADIDAVQQRKEELLAMQAASQAKIDGLKEQQASVMEQKEALDERNTYATAQLALVREQVEMYEDIIRQKAQEVADAKATEEEQLLRYRTRVRAMEENGNFNLLALFMNVKSFGELLSAIDDIGAIMERDRNLETDYIAAREEHERVQAEYTRVKAELVVKQTELEAEQEELENMIAEASALIEELEKDIEKAIQEYEEAERARRAAEAQIGNLIAQLNAQNAALAAQQAAQQQQQQQQQAQQGGQSAEQPSEQPDGQGAEQPNSQPAEQTPPQQAPVDSGLVSAGSAGVSGTGSLVWPVPSGHTVTSRFGNRIHPITGEERFHSGMDIDGYGNDGGAIVACDGGVIAKAAWYGGYGNCVIIDHGNGMQTLYAHMSGFAVSEGDVVTQGQTIGYLGATGVATGTHCHLEIFVGGNRTDPENYFSGMTFYDC